jgi:putative flippase GtrA
VLSSRFFRFVLAGGTAAIVNYGSRFAFSTFLPFPVAIVCAYFIGMTAAFLLNRAFVFHGATNSTANQALWFALVNVAAVVQTLAISLILAWWLLPALGITNHAEAIAHAVGVAVPVVTSYLGHRRLTFRSAHGAPDSVP